MLGHGIIIDTGHKVKLLCFVATTVRVRKQYFLIELNLTKLVRYVTALVNISIFYSAANRICWFESDGDCVCKRSKKIIQSVVSPLAKLVFVQIMRVIEKTQYLEGTAGSTAAHLAGAVAVAADVDLGQLGDGDDRDGGVQGDAERKVKVSIK